MWRGLVRWRMRRWGKRGMISESLVIACGIAANLAAVIICLSDREKPLSPRKLWRAICKDQGIDQIRLQMALHPVEYARLPQGGGARDPRPLQAPQVEYIDGISKSFDYLKSAAGR